jgi:hypothetical protein
MELRGKRILLLSPEPWEGLHMSKHHLSQALAERGNTVCFVDPPASDEQDISVRAVGEVNLVRYRHWLRGVNRLPDAVNRWYYKRLITRIADRTGGAFDIIWCFDTSRMQVFPDGIGLRVLHLADYDILHMGRGLIPSADIIFTTGQVVADAVLPRARCRVVNLGHALDARWLNGIDALAERPARAVRNVVFMGQLVITYNDWDGFNRIVRNHPELEFIFIGPYSDEFPDPAFKELRQHGNARFTGLLAKDALIPMVRDADLLFFGFRSGTVSKERANPHKVLEYLSTGNVIAGSYTMEYGPRTDLFVMAPEGGDLLTAFDLALRDHDQLNAPAARARRIAFAQARSMDRLIARIESELDPH